MGTFYFSTPNSNTVNLSNQNAEITHLANETIPEKSVSLVEPLSNSIDISNSAYKDVNLNSDSTLDLDLDKKNAANTSISCNLASTRFGAGQVSVSTFKNSVNFENVSELQGDEYTKDDIENIVPKSSTYPPFPPFPVLPDLSSLHHVLSSHHQTTQQNMRALSPYENMLSGALSPKTKTSPYGSEYSKDQDVEVTDR